MNKHEAADMLIEDGYTTWQAEDIVDKARYLRRPQPFSTSDGRDYAVVFDVLANKYHVTDTDGDILV